MRLCYALPYEWAAHLATGLSHLRNASFIGAGACVNHICMGLSRQEAVSLLAASEGGAKIGE